MKHLKSELAALDSKMTAELAPKHDENDGTEVKKEQSQQPQLVVKAETTKTIDVNTPDTTQGNRPSIVAEPYIQYKNRAFRI